MLARQATRAAAPECWPLCFNKTLTNQHCIYTCCRLSTCRTLHTDFTGAVQLSVKRVPWEHSPRWLARPASLRALWARPVSFCVASTLEMPWRRTTAALNESDGVASSSARMATCASPALMVAPGARTCACKHDMCNTVIITVSEQAAIMLRGCAWPCTCTGRHFCMCMQICCP